MQMEFLPLSPALEIPASRGSILKDYLFDEKSEQRTGPHVFEETSQTSKANLGELLGTI